MLYMCSMKHYQLYRSWMYDKTFRRRHGLKRRFKKGVVGFLTYAFVQEYCRSEGRVRYLCLKCGCRNIISNPSEVKRHLVRVDFRPNFWVWAANGEKSSNMK